MEDTVEQIVALAQLRWLQAEEVQVVLTGTPNGPSPGAGNLPKWTRWDASIRLGGGKWGELAGEGVTPQMALDALRSNLLTAHKAVDERRAEVYAEVSKGHLPKGADSVGGGGNVDTRQHVLDAAWATRCAVLDEVMRQAQHATSGGQVWEILTKMRNEPRPAHL